MVEAHLPVEEAYNRWAPNYDSYDNPMVFMAGEAVRQTLLAPPAVRGAHVFEFGCGTGRNLAAFQQAGAATVSGCDFSEGMLRLAAARSASFRLLRHDMMAREPLGLPAASFDIVLFCLALEHVPDLVSPLREARRLLKPEGRVAIVEIHPYFSLGGAAAHFEDGAETVTMPTYPHQFEDYLAAFADTGLQVAACREWRPRDARTEPPPKVLRRGLDFRMAVSFELTHTG